MKKLLPFLALLLLAGCSAETEPATNITSTSALLKGKLSCEAGESGTFQWQWSALNSGPGNYNYSHTPAQRFGHPGDLFSCPASAPIQRQITGLTSGTHYMFQLCGTLDQLPDKYLCGSKFGVSLSLSAPVDDFYTLGFLRVPDSAVPDPVVYAQRGFPLAEQDGRSPSGKWQVSGWLAPAGTCCASGYLAPVTAQIDPVQAWLAGAASFWGHGVDCPGWSIAVTWLNEPSVWWLGQTVNSGCTNGPNRQMWLNCRGDCNAVIPGRSWYQTWCMVVVHEYGHLIGLGHSTDPANIMNPSLDNVPLPWVCS